MAIAVYLEVGKKRVFACALEWPGWCRSGNNEQDALAALAANARRYAVIAREAHVPFSYDAAEGFEVVERLPGNGTTDFGAPAKTARGDTTPVSPDEAERLAALLAASWRVFDRTVRRTPAELPKGPRGGGRDRDEIVRHVLAAETAYGRTIRVRRSEPEYADASAVASSRSAILEALRSSHDSTRVQDWNWLPRYAARRMAWHVLDHAWEMEDKANLTPQ